MSTNESMNACALFFLPHLDLRCQPTAALFPLRVCSQWFVGSALSRVNSSEPSYRLPFVRREKNNTNHTHTYQLLGDIQRLIEQNEMVEHLHMRCTVHGASATGLHSWRVQLALQPGCSLLSSMSPSKYTCKASVVVLTVNRRLGAPRQLVCPEEAQFAGRIARGMAGQGDEFDCVGQVVVVVGMGAFGIENASTVLERSAVKVTIVCRQHGTVQPHMVDWVRFIRHADRLHGATDRRGDDLLFAKWQSLYKDSGATQPECWQVGLVKPDGHTLSASDMFFLAHRLHLLSTTRGVVHRLEPTAIVCGDGTRVPADVLLKCVGYEIHEGNEQLLGRSRRPGAGPIARHLWIFSEPHLDEVFSSNRILTAGHMNGAWLMAMQALGCWRDPVTLTRKLHQRLPSFRINFITASEMGTALDLALASDAGEAQAHMALLDGLADDFDRTMDLEEVLVHNETLWDLLNALLQKQVATAHQQNEEPPPSRLPYPFASLASDLTDVRSGRTYSLNAMAASLGILTTPAVNALTFYEGVAPVVFLRERLAAMATSNPWLAGRLIAGDGGAISLQAPLPSFASIHFTEVQSPWLSARMPDVAAAIEGSKAIGVKLGLECIDADEPLFSVHVLHTGSGTFATLVSLSHVIGDAATFYTLCGMLDLACSPPCVRLDPTPLPAFTAEAVTRAFGSMAGRAFDGLQSSKPPMPAEALKMHRYREQQAHAKRASVHVLDACWLAAGKATCAEEAAATGQAFVSSNDILASWHFGRVRASHGLIVCDCRGRLPGLPSAAIDFTPGTYIASIACQVEDFASAVAVRRKVAKTLQRAQMGHAADDADLTACKQPKSPSHAVVANQTNWAAAYVHVELPGCQHVAHVPIVDSALDMFDANFYVFRPRRGELAVLSFESEINCGNAADDGPLMPWEVLPRGEVEHAKGDAWVDEQVERRRRPITARAASTHQPAVGDAAYQHI